VRQEDQDDDVVHGVADCRDAETSPDEEARKEEACEGVEGEEAEVDASGGHVDIVIEGEGDGGDDRAQDEADAGGLAEDVDDDEVDGGDEDDAEKEFFIEAGACGEGDPGLPRKVGDGDTAGGGWLGDGEAVGGHGQDEAEDEEGERPDRGFEDHGEDDTGLGSPGIFADGVPDEQEGDEEGGWHEATGGAEIGEQAEQDAVGADSFGDSGGGVGEVADGTDFVDEDEREEENEGVEGSERLRTVTLFAESLRESIWR